VTSRGDLLDPVHDAALASLERNLGATQGTSEDRMIEEVHLGHVDDAGRFQLLCGYDHVTGSVIESVAGACGEPIDSEPYLEAVNLVTSSHVSYVLALGESRGSDLTKAGFARTDAIGSLQVGTQLASVSSRQSQLLNELFTELLCPPVDELAEHTCDLDHPDVDIGAAGWSSLADADITFGDLMDGVAEVGSPDQVLDTAVSVEDLLDITAAALDDQGNPAAAHVTVLAGAVDSSHTLDVTLAGEEDGIYDVAVGQPGSAADASVNVLDMLRTAAMIANGDRVVDVPGLDVDIDGLSSLTGRMVVGEAPQPKIGRPGEAVARTAQVRIALDADLVDLDLLGLAEVDVNLPLYLDLAGGEAALTGLGCGDPHDPDQTDTTADVLGTVRTAGLAIGDMGDEWLEDGGEVSEPEWARLIEGVVHLTTTVLGLEVGTEIELAYDGRSSAIVGGQSEALSFTGPYRADWQSVGAEGAGLGQLVANLELQRVRPSESLLDALLEFLELSSSDELVAELVQVVGEVVVDLEEELVSDLVDVLGVQIGRADVRMLWVDCSPRSLGPLQAPE
jgi:uncharacterized membrane protein